LLQETSSLKALDPGNQASRSYLQCQHQPIDTFVFKKNQQTCKKIIGFGVLLGRSIIQGSRYNVDDPVGNAQGLVECLTVTNHFFEHLPRSIIFGRSDAELLNFFELVNAEDAESVAPMAV
jgi:hypothetical protein